MIDLVKDGLTVYADIIELTAMFFEDSITYTADDQKLLGTDDTRKVFAIVKEKIEKDTDFTPDSIEQIIHTTVTETGLGKGKVLRPLRVALTARQHGPALKNTLYLLGKDTCMSRLLSL